MRKIENKSDVEKVKWLAVIAYFVFFVPLIVDKESDFLTFHANQGLDLFLLTLVVTIFGFLIPIIGWVIILPVGLMLSSALFVLGIVNAINGKTKELPIIGVIRLIK